MAGGLSTLSVKLNHVPLQSRSLLGVGESTLMYKHFRIAFVRSSLASTVPVTLLLSAVSGCKVENRQDRNLKQIERQIDALDPLVKSADIDISAAEGDVYPDPFGQANTSDIAQNIETAALSILAKNCLGCHNPGNALGQFGDVGDIAAMIASQKFLVPGQPQASRIYQAITQTQTAGIMPPSGALKPAEIRLIKKWIETGLGGRKPVKTLAINEIYTLIDKDISQMPPERANLYRYFSLKEGIAGGSAATKLDDLSQALIKTVNSLSQSPKLFLPQKIDDAGLVVRISLEDMQISSEVFEEFISQYYPFTIKAGNDDLAERQTKISELAGTEHFFIRADWFISTATVSPHYEKLLQLANNIPEFEQELNINTLQAFENNNIIRSGFSDSGVSEYNRIIERQDVQQNDQKRFYWRSYDFSSNSSLADIFFNPLGSSAVFAELGATPSLGFQEDGGEIIFQLPNGLPGYYLADAAGQQINKGPTAIVKQTAGGPSQLQTVIVNGISCMSCHHAGIKNKEDQVKGRIKNIGKVFQDYFNQDALDKIENIYKEPEVFTAAVDSDNTAVIEALTYLGLDKNASGDKIGKVFSRYNRTLNKSQVISELSITSDILDKILQQENIIRDWGSLTLPGGTIPRATFNRLYGQAALAASEALHVPPGVGDFLISNDCLQADELLNLDTNCTSSYNP